MRTQNRPFRLTASVAIAALLVAQALPRPAFAQGAPPPPPQAAAPDQQTGDPPARVGRLAQISGTVSFHTQDETQWSPATRNYPVTQGDAFWAEPNAQAVIEVSASRVALAPGTELDVTTLTDTAFQATAPQGELYLRVRAATPDESYAVQTPRGLVTLTAPGSYGIVAGDTQSPTSVTVLEGSAHIEGPGVSLDVSAPQAMSITGTDTFVGQVVPAQRDAFLTAMINSERPPQPQAVAPPPAVAAMPGGDDLAQYGSWSESPEYGQVWYPQVAPDWVPYREGSWAYVAPWGWTWVDNSPWGFAPFHYGRWAEVRGRWGWIPGVAVGVPVPVYAPALVTFIGVGAVVGIGIGAALAEGRIGWCPLGPREAFRPWYHASDRYYRQVNVAHVTNITTINRNVTINNFANRGAATVVPTSTMTGSRPVAASFQRLAPAQIAQARPVFGQQPLRPTTATVGVTPAVAHQLNLRPTTPGLRRVAPGPVIQATPVVSTGVAARGAAAHQALPELHNPAAVVPATTTLHPVSTTPGLHAPPAPGQIGPPAIMHGPTTVAPGAVTNVPPAINHGGNTTPATITHTAPLTTAPPLVQHGGATVTPPPITHTGPLTTAPPVTAPGGTGPATITHTAPLVPRGGTTTMPPAAAHTAPLTAVPPPPVIHGGGTTTTPATITHAAPLTTTPPPTVHAPPPVVSHAPVTPMVTHVAPITPPPVVHTPPAPVVVHPAAPAAVYHPPPPPVVHTAPPVVHTAPAPAPQYHPPPPPVVHTAPPVVHAAPAPAPQYHPPPPPPPAAHNPPPQNNQKKPGQP